MSHDGLTLGLLLGFALLLGGCGGGGGGLPPTPGDQRFLEVAPDVGTTAGGTEVTLRGSGFLDPVRRIRDVRFGTSPAAQWEIVDDETILVVSPPGVAGATVIDLVGDNAPASDGVLLTRGFLYRAPRLYAAEGAGVAQPGLYSVDLDTGAQSLIGPIGFRVESMATSEAGALYAVASDVPKRLIRIDVTTGAGTSVGPLQEAVSGDPVAVRDLSFLGDQLLGRTETLELVGIDLATGTVVVWGQLPITTPGGGMTREDDNSVYLADAGPSRQLYELDVQTGGLAPGPVLARTVDFRDLTRGETRLYALDGATPGGGLGLVRIDPGSGSVEVVAPLPAAVTAVAGHF